MRIIFILISFLVGLLSCKPSETSTNMVTESQSFTPIEIQSGNNGRFPTETNLLISNQKDFLTIWEQAFANYMNKEAIPEIDFNKNSILLVAFGEKTSGGHSIKINSVIESQKNTTVTILKTSPGKGCVTTESITYPYQIVLIEKPTKEIIFVGTEKIIDCESE